MSPCEPQPIAVAVVRQAGRVLIGQRPPGAPLSGCWNFPAESCGRGKIPNRPPCGNAWKRPAWPSASIAFTARCCTTMSTARCGFFSTPPSRWTRREAAGAVCVGGDFRAGPICLSPGQRKIDRPVVARNRVLGNHGESAPRRFRRNPGRAAGKGPFFRRKPAWRGA